MRLGDASLQRVLCLAAVRAAVSSTVYVRTRRTGMASVSVRYMVNDVDEAISFYCQQLGFTEVMHPAPTFAMLSRRDLRLVLSSTGGGPEAVRPCRTARYRNLAVGIDSRSRCRTLPRR